MSKRELTKDEYENSTKGFSGMQLDEYIKIYCDNKHTRFEAKRLPFYLEWLPYGDELNYVDYDNKIVASIYSSIGD